MVIFNKMSLLKFLKENENVRKVFGKRELKIIEKQLLGVNLTQSEKNRLSRDIRKKFEFVSSNPPRAEKAWKLWARITRVMEEYDFRKALAFIFNFVDWNNELISQMKPWEKEGFAQKEIIGYLLENIRQIALALKPFLPQTSAKIAKTLGVSLEGDFEKLKKWGSVKTFKLKKPEILFPKRQKSF